MNNIIPRLNEVLFERKQADPNHSYVASLYAAGTNKILKKLIEEATEIVIASNSDDHEDIIHETADLWFHTMILLAHHDINVQTVLDELDRRFGLSGLVEKANRGDG